ncbi:hypothetical protein KDJ56_13795 [Brevibacillus composti]|uniref:Uncharacterized protein n=1 Tax=Brevibacillus composti TaxID=2796470 RepID=A0A7T5EI35_9BACL|nr:hypothetical protein [Brevibacillus composti]QQE73014.1 hypothetical protein JD108_13850 [Brevibacillus composti]QUO40092.1 hypothetical protein KDJ56_13795 [Brevibacillus composti]
MKRWLLLVILGSICMAAVGVLKDVYQSRRAEETARTVQAGEREAFERAFQRLVIGQQDHENRRPVVEFEKSKMPKQAIQLGIHSEDAYIHIDVATSQSLEAAEGFLSQVELIGDVNYSTSAREVSKGNYQLSMYFSGVRDQFGFRFGNIPTITLKRMDPLALSIRPGKSEGALMVMPESRDSTALYLTEGLNQIELHFSEPMIKEEEAGMSVNGYPAVWLDERTISLNVSQIRGNALNLTSLLSRSGNYLPEEYGYVSLYKKEKRSWLAYPESKVVGFSPYDSFYQQLIFSPDRKSYVGIIDRGKSPESAGGRRVALVLEQKGQASTLLEPAFTSTSAGSRLQRMIQWLDDDRILYAGEKTGIVYRISTGEKQQLFDERNTGFAAVESAVDREAGSLYLLFVKPAGEKNRYAVEKRSYRLETLALEGTDGFGELVHHPREPFPALPITVRRDGVYYTKEEQQKTTTWYLSRQGESWSAEGEVVWADDQRHAVLKREHEEKKAQYMWWPIGKKPREIPLSRGELRSFGPYLVADDGLHYHLWDRRRMKWEPLDLAEGEIRLPVSDDIALYSRVR